MFKYPQDKIDYYTEDVPEPNYECVYCKKKVYIGGEYRKRTGHWCKGECNQMRTHRKLDD